MRTLFLAVMVFMDLALFAQYPYVVPSIPSGGQVYQIDSTSSPNSVFVGTGNATVNLGSNSYSLQYNGTPRQGTTFVCRFDATKLTAVAANVSIFGLTPLKDFPGQGVYYIAYTVQGTNAANKTAFSYYTGSMIQPGGNFNADAIFNRRVTFYDSVHFQPDRNPIPTGAYYYASNDSGAGRWSRVPPWITSGNIGLSSATDELGTMDSVILQFVQNGQPAGLIDYTNQLTAFGSSSLSGANKGDHNVAIGVSAMGSSQTGNNNVAIGVNALTAASSSSVNVAVGSASLESVTSGGGNVGVGYETGQITSTGIYNTAIGGKTMTSNISGNYNTIIGAGADVATSSTSHAIVLGGMPFGSGLLGYTNAFTVGGEYEVHPNMNSAVGDILTDTSGNKTFVPQKPFSITGNPFTPVTGDSIAVTNSKSTVNPPGTLANLTIIFPANPVPYQSYVFNFQQAITALHYSIRLSGGANPLGLPSAEAQYGTFSAYWEPSINTWVAGSH